MEDTFKLVIFNKDMFSEIKKHRHGKIYKEYPEYIINILLKQRAPIEKFKLFKDIFKNFTTRHHKIVIKTDQNMIYKELYTQNKEDIIEAAENDAREIVKYLLSKYNYDFEQDNGRPTIIEAIQRSVNDQNKYMYQRLRFIIEKSKMIYVADLDNVVYYLDNDLKAIRTKVNRNICINFNGYMKDFKYLFY